MTVLIDIGTLATCPPDAAAQGEIGLIERAALVWDDAGAIVWAGPEAGVPAAYADFPRESARGGLVVPGLVDCHTHLAFGGDRAGEFVARLRGADYLAQARQGGGIAATMRATRAATEDELLDGARSRLAAMLALGVTTVEAKTGYGLSLDAELKTLRVYEHLAADVPQRIVPTLLAAHTVPPEFADDRAAYVRLVCETIIPAAAGRAVFCDAFVEVGAFTADEAERVFAAGRSHGMTPKLHADQLSDTGGAALAARVGAASADHLEYVSEAGIAALAAAGTVAVSLPIATLVLGQEPLPARRLLDAGVPVAVATDFNPGSAPSLDLHLALWLACTRQRMTPAEALAAATSAAARALGLAGVVGSLVPGARADWVVLDAPDVDRWLYDFRPGRVRRVVISGRTVWPGP
ncbi:MAG TPA: imidazolonepropionase [Rubricoccaceae bacterium]